MTSEYRVRVAVEFLAADDPYATGCQVGDAMRATDPRSDYCTTSSATRFWYYVTLSSGSSCDALRTGAAVVEEHLRSTLGIDDLLGTVDTDVASSVQAASWV